MQRLVLVPLLLLAALAPGRQGDGVLTDGSHGAVTAVAPSGDPAAPPGAASAADAAPVLIGTFQPAASGGACAAWDARCARTQLGRDPADGSAWSITVSFPAGQWRWRIALGGDASTSVGRGTRFDGADGVFQLASPGDVTFVFDGARRVAAASTDDGFAWAWQEPGPCPQGGPAPPAVRPSAVLFDPAGEGIARAIVDLAAGACLRMVTRNGTTAVPVATDGLAGLVAVAFDPVAGTATAWPWTGAPAADGHLDPLGFGHDSRDPAYRSPSGSSPAGSPIRLRFRTFHADATSVDLVTLDTVTNTRARTAMRVVGAGLPCGEAPVDAVAPCDFWEATITPSAPTTLRYRFEVRDGSARGFYADDALLDGGRGAATRNATDTTWVITVSVPGVQPVPWLAGAVVYQVFPDRFRNGNPANDVNVNAPRYAWPPDPADRNVRRAWSQLPADPGQGRDWFGGDLAGVTTNLGYLKDLGVTVLYLNPIFAAASNHAYDTRDYTTIDPRFGTPADWVALVKAAKARGIHVVLDGVFNHVSSDSPYFDRYGHYPTVGACESVSSPYRTWFTFRPAADGPCAGPDGRHTMDYTGWSNVASLPVLAKTDPGVQALVYAGPGAVAKRWIQSGASGWRLDAMADPSFPPAFWQAFRAAVKAVDPEAVIVGEIWQRDQVLPAIRGDMVDTITSYRFRNAVTGYLGTIDQEGFPDAGASDQPPSLLAGKLLGMYEDMPAFAAETSWNLLDSHDTERILWSLAPAGDAAAKQATASLALAKARLHLATLLQFTMPGAPTIYYGDELGMTGGDDPGDRRTFPVLGSGGTLPAGADADLHAWYAGLAAARHDHPVLRDGGLRFLVTDDRTRTVAYSRTDGAGSLALVAMNPDTTAPATVRIPLADARGPGVGVPDGVVFTDLVGNRQVTSAGGYLAVQLPPLGGALLVPAAPIPRALAAPAAPAATPAGAERGAALTWSAVPGATGYAVYRTALPGADPELVGRSSQPALTDTLPTAGTWRYTVRAVDRAGWLGAASVEALVTVSPTPPATPSATGPGSTTAASPAPTPPAGGGGDPGLPGTLLAIALVLAIGGLGVVLVALRSRPPRARR